MRQRLEAEPVFGDLLVESTVRQGVVQITAPGITDQQQLRARELALTVPGAQSVTFLP
jgi:hypothetical protein